MNTAATPHYRATLDSPVGTLSLVATDHALVALVWRLQSLSRIPVELPDRMPSYGLITRLGEPPTPSAQAFIDVLRETAGVAPDVVGE